MLIRAGVLPVQHCVCTEVLMPILALRFLVCCASRKVRVDSLPFTGPFRGLRLAGPWLVWLVVLRCSGFS